MMNLHEAYERAAGILREARRVLFVTGAGLSADSGLPTYRGVGGLYADGQTEAGVPVEVALSGPMFQMRPDLTWQHITRIEAACRDAQPNRGHEVIAEFETHAEVVVLTQNVDGFHRAAGSTRVVEIHGAIHRLRCTSCSWRDEVEDFAELSPVPKCPRCGAVIRPDVVLFEEMLPEEALDDLRAEARRGFDAVFSVGTSSLFPYIIEPVISAAQRSIPTVEVNPGRTELSELVEVKLEERAAVALDAVAARL
jgi:NAD-dependent deacetylase